MDPLFSGDVCYPFLDPSCVNRFVGQNCIKLNMSTVRSLNVAAIPTYGEMIANPGGLGNMIPVTNSTNTGLDIMKTIYNTPPPVLCESPGIKMARLETIIQGPNLLGQFGGMNTSANAYQDNERLDGEKLYTPPGYNPRQPPPQIGQKRSYDQMVQSPISRQSSPFTSTCSRLVSGTNGFVNAQSTVSTYQALRSQSSSFHCPRCNVTCLDVQTFAIHKQSTQHLSRVSDRNTDALINRFNATAEPASTEPFCKTCNRRYSGTLLNHQKGPEHKRKERLTKRGCVLCQTGPYTTYPEYVKHIDSAEHKQQKDDLQSEMKERESLGIAVNPAYFSKPGPIKASRIVQDALQKSALPAVSLQESGITFHPPKTVTTHPHSNTVNTTVVGYYPSVTTSSANCPTLVNVTGTSARIENVASYPPTVTKAALSNHCMSTLGQVCHAKQGQAFGIASISNTLTGKILSTAVRQGISNCNVPAGNNFKFSSSLLNNSIQSINSNIAHKDSRDLQNQADSSPKGRSHSHVNCFNHDPTVSISTRNGKKSYTGDISKVSAMQSKNDNLDDLDDTPKVTRWSSDEGKHASIGMVVANEEKGVDDRQFVVPVSGYFCSLCDVFYIDGDTPHRQTQRHADLLKKVKSNGSKKPVKKSISSINTWIHEQLDRKNPHEKVDEDVIGTTQTSDTNSCTMDDVKILDTEDQTINQVGTKTILEPSFNETISSIDNPAQDKQAQAKDSNENIST